MVIDNDIGQNLAEVQKLKNYLILAKSQKSKIHQNSAISKKSIIAQPYWTPNADATGYFTAKARKAFTCLRQAFTKALIFWHFDLECHIRIETNTSGSAISGVFIQLKSDWVTPHSSNLTKSDFGQWHLVAYFSGKMILAKTRYKTHNAELLAIIEAFKTWRHYLKGCKHKVLVLTNHKNLRWFINTKRPSFRQVWWAQKLSKYHFKIDHCQGKANEAADTLFCFVQRIKTVKNKLKLKNT